MTPSACCLMFDNHPSLTDCFQMRSVFWLSVTSLYHRARSRSSPLLIWYHRTCCLCLLRSISDLWFLRTSTNKLFEASLSRSDNFTDCMFLCLRGAEALAESTSQSASSCEFSVSLKNVWKHRSVTDISRLLPSCDLYSPRCRMWHFQSSIYHWKIDRCEIWLLQTNVSCRSDASVTGSFSGRADICRPRNWK